MMSYAKPGSMGSLIKTLLENSEIHAVFAPARSPYSALPMPMLITDPEMAENADPLAPVMPLNAARQAASVLKHPTGRKTVFFMKPCEIRALVELVKLNQCSLEDAVIIGTDCMGRMENQTFLELSEKQENLTESFYRDSSLQEHITGTCGSCTRFLPENADLTLCLMGTGGEAVIGSNTEAGNKILELLCLENAEEPASRSDSISQMEKQRQEAYLAMAERTAAITSPMEAFQKSVANCINCYNCRTVCPVCYCKECVFNTDIFAHSPETLHMRSEKKGAVKLPSDTTMFHMTRLTHISHSCVGCGQCSSVCPSNIPVADIFRTITAGTQEMFGYIPGKSIDEPVPYLAYKEE